MRFNSPRLFTVIAHHWTMRYLVFFLAALLIAVPEVRATGVGAERPETPVLIVDRRADAISLFFSLPAIELPAVFGMGGEALLGPDQTIDIVALYDGTFDLADRIFAQVETASGGQSVTFEALSMMVHDPDVLPDFQTPWDGETAIAVCTSPETVDNLGLEPLQVYLGYFAWKLNGLDPLTLRFAGASDDTVIEVRDFWNRQHLGTTKMTFGPGRTITLNPGTGAPLSSHTLGILALALAGVGVVLLVLHRRDQRDTGKANAS